jgi:hypothetical protein
MADVVDGAYDFGQMLIPLILYFYYVFATPGTVLRIIYPVRNERKNCKKKKFFKNECCRGVTLLPGN